MSGVRVQVAELLNQLESGLVPQMEAGLIYCKYRTMEDYKGEDDIARNS